MSDTYSERAAAFLVPWSMPPFGEFAEGDAPLASYILSLAATCDRLTDDLADLMAAAPKAPTLHRLTLGIDGDGRAIIVSDEIVDDPIPPPGEENR